MAEDNKIKFSVARAKAIREMYSDEMSRKRRQDQSPSYSAQSYSNAAAVREAIQKAISSKDTIVEASKKLYATNPIYATVIDYMANMFMWKWKVVPHKIWTKSKAKARKSLPVDDYKSMYNLMLEVVEGLSIETKFPAMLTALFIEGSVFFTTASDEDSLTIDTIVLPTKYCRKVGQTQYGTAIIEFDFQYFTDLGMTEQELKDYLKTWPKEYSKGYNKYKTNSTDNRWQQMDPRFTSGLMQNEVGIPAYYYIAGGILDFEKYQDNELERNENMLKYLVVQTMPHFEDNLIFEADELKAVHQSIKKIVDVGNKARLITTYGDVHVDKISENDTSENEVLSKAFKAIFNDAGFNSALFTGESVEGLKISLTRDKTIVWKFVDQLVSFYTLTINNWYDFKGYQADVEILPISLYTYDNDIESYRQNATLGIGKLDYVIASGIKQKDIQDTFDLEKMLDFTQIVPLQTSYTQTAEDRNTEDEDDDDKSDPEKESEIEPSDDEKGTETQDTVEVK